MKKTLIILTALLFALSVSAQRRGRKAQQPKYTVTAQEAMAAYDFSLAEEILEQQIADQTRKKQPTEQTEALLETVRKSQLRLHATEQVTFIDSVLLPKKQVLGQIKLSQECGSIMSYTDFFKTGKDSVCTLFCNELGNYIVYAEANKKGQLRLKDKSLIGGEWSMERQLTGFEEKEGDNLNYPFMLSDGITMYFAAECEESIGGYDIFMTRYDADNGKFFAPENIGMPFNSPANDYLMIIDDFQQLGWFVTDRNQPADTVCLYTFIPTQTRRIYNEEQVGAQKLASLARIASIKDTWTDKNAVEAAKKRLAEARQGLKNETRNRDFTFVVNDHRTCYTLTDFKNKQAQQKAKIWVEAQKEYESKSEGLSALRGKYATMSEAQRGQIAAQIRLTETSLERLAADKLALEKEIRRLELNK
ncbi:MAG: hypothetical protein IKQ37_00150 [Bacteroidaceae bacterium]|nr:hypothetical protein [Bacteroidaceae bacterium]